MFDDDPIFEMSEQLDQDNEHLRMRLLETTAWMEGAVTDQVACERRLVEIEDQATALQAELDAIYQTMTCRMIAPVRRLYGRIRSGRSTQ